MPTTTHRNYQKPDVANSKLVDVVRLRAALDAIDVDVNQLIADIAAKTFASLVAKPTTLAGYGITDAYTQAQIDAAIATAISDLIGGAPAALDTLNEIAASIADDADLAGTLTALIATKLALSGGTMTGDIDMDGNSLLNVGNLETVPVGTSLLWPLFNPPAGFLVRDGSVISRTTYANLFAAITDNSEAGDTTNNSPTVTNIGSTAGWGTGMHVEAAGIPSGTTISSVDSGTQITLSQNATATASGVSLRVLPWGQGDGSTTFSLPEGRAEFERGWDAGRGVDSGRVFGSAQGDELKSHNHDIQYRGSSPLSAGDMGYGYNNGSFVDNTWAIQATGGSETRPRNIAMLPIIKF